MKNLLILPSFLFAFICSAAEKKLIDFNRDIRPILSDKCFQCHGPDEESLEADLRLDQRSSAVDDLKSIIPGDAEASEVIFRITTDADDDLMPPSKIKKPVTESEIALLKQWIEEGAEYEEHWSFQPIKNPKPPTVKKRVWAKNEIDQFILAQLESKGIEPSKEADPHTLIRRLSLDLVGLLPEVEQIEAFASAYEMNADKAVRNAVDELLASPHYGERWGRHWLDQARYADSHGYTIDGERTMWPFRDWVIQAVNSDMPFDQFTIEQIAGDLLEKPTNAQLVASGFHRNTLINQEGGTDDEQFRNEEVVDRVNTTGAVWLGLTLSCAQCHTHKFDPIQHREYFEVFAFFNQQTDVNNTGQTVEVAEGELFLENADPNKLTALEVAKKQVASLNASKAKRQIEWEKNLLAGKSKADANRPGAQWNSMKPTEYSGVKAKLALLDDDSILAGAGAPNETYTVKLPAPNSPVAALRLRLIPDESLPKNGPGRAGNGNIVLTRIEFKQGEKTLTVARAQEDHAQPDFSAAFTIDGNPDTGWAINVGKGSAPGMKMNAPHEAHFIFAEPVLPKNGPVTVTMHHEKNANYNVGRFAFDESTTLPRKNETADDKLFAILKQGAKKRGKDEAKFVSTEFAKADVELKKANAKLTDASSALGFGKIVKTMVMRDLPAEQHRDTFIHTRGDFLRKDKDVGKLSPGPLAIFPAMAKADKPADRNRLDLANWLVDPKNPLTARVTVNRVWMRYFGKGIVETENDFGTQGSFPTHPELLDWLATKFVEGGWSMKQLHRLITTSTTYRQSSIARPDLKEIDPLNHLLARQNRIRFDAEIVRDASLSASGLLSKKLGGPSVTPPQPNGVYAFTQSKKTWNVPNGPDRYRRAMYVKFIRSAPYPLLTTFDSPDFQSVCTARPRSNTPLQSLTMANDLALFEMAQGLASRVLTEVEGSDSSANRERIRRAFLLTVSRNPDKSEIEVLASFQEQQAAAFAADLENAKAVAPSKIPKGIEIPQAASWTAVARALMNTDEFISRE